MKRFFKMAFSEFGCELPVHVCFNRADYWIIICIRGIYSALFADVPRFNGNYQAGIVQEL